MLQYGIASAKRFILQMNFPEGVKFTRNQQFEEIQEKS
jgi:hypothetical protein